MMLLALAVPAVASTAASQVEGFAFHCNTFNGNGRTYIEGKDKDFGKFDKKTGAGLLGLILDTSDPTAKTWFPVFEEEMVCTTCGSSEWVSFSNKSGVPDGKNIQLQHPGEAVAVTKTWIKNNAPEYYAENFPLAKLRADFVATIGSKDYKFSISSTVAAAKGSFTFFVPADLLCNVAETGCNMDFELNTDLSAGLNFVNEDEGGTVINSSYYYAACQLYHDILYGFNNSSLDASFYNGLVPFGGVNNWAGDILHPVGLAHRDAIQMYVFGYTFDADWRYEPLPLNDEAADQLRIDWETNITNALREVCDVLGIDVDAFFAAYGADSIEVQAKYHAGI